MNPLKKRAVASMFMFLAGLFLSAQQLTGSWYENTLHEKSRFRNYFYRIYDKQLSVIDKKNDTETFFDYKIEGDYITISSKNYAYSPKIATGKYPISISDDDNFTIYFDSLLAPMSFIRNSASKAYYVNLVKNLGAFAVTAFGVAVLADAGATALSDYKKFDSNTMLLPTGAITPNTSYTSCGYNYTTDSMGRICKYWGSPKFADGVRNKSAQLAAGGADRLPGDEGGHLFATIFGGSGGLENLVAMNASVNRGEYKKLENIWSDALSRGKSVEVSGECFYEGSSMRPVKFVVTYIIDGVKNKATIFNQ